MKVLHVPERPPWTLETTCADDECNAKLLVEANDVYAYGYQSSPDYCFACGNCGHRNIIKPSTSPLPRWLKKQAVKHSRTYTYSHSND